MILSAESSSPKPKQSTTINIEGLQQFHFTDATRFSEQHERLKGEPLREIAIQVEDGERITGVSSNEPMTSSIPSMIVPIEKEEDFEDLDEDGSEYQEITYVRIDPPLVIPIKSIIRYNSNSYHSSPSSDSSSASFPQELRVPKTTRPKSVRFTLDVNYCLYERTSIPSACDSWIVSHRKISVAKSGKKRKKIISRKTTTRKRKSSQSCHDLQVTKKSRYPHPSKILIVFVFIAILVVFLVAKKKKKEVNDPLDLLFAFI